MVPGAWFPYEAYECQLHYMRSVVRALEGRGNALLESPTGTGKTLCLLCASLGWRRYRERQVASSRASWEAQGDLEAAAPRTSCPRIWYASRTHSQLKQVVRELKRTTYKPSSVVLGSREHFCIHMSVRRQKGAKQNACCKRARDEDRCPFYSGLRKFGGKVSTSLLDIEEIVNVCQEKRICPFYKSREEAREAELLMIPYDYLISPQTRGSLQVSLKNSILIFDEGHNIEKSCEHAASFELGSFDIANAIAEIDDACVFLENFGVSEKLAGALDNMTPSELGEHLNLLKKNLLAFETAVDHEELYMDQTYACKMRKSAGSYILHILGGGGHSNDGITPKDAKRITLVVRNAIAVLTFRMDSAGSSVIYLDKLQSLLVSALRHGKEDLDKHYQVLLYEDTADVAKRGSKRKVADFFNDMSSTTGKDKPQRTLCLWCFSCSVVLRELMEREVHSIIITSGTLSPIEGTVQAFGLPFPVVLENKHVIDAKKQLWGGVLRAGPDNVRLDASFGKRNDPAYLRDLGQAVCALAGCVPDGFLLAFQSYSQKEDVLRSWRQSGVLEEIGRRKPLFDEPQQNSEMQRTMDLYNKALDRTPAPGAQVGGAILAAVCRGKLCEGIDFTDRQCRMVCIVGIPFPARNDLRVLLKQEFLSGKEKDAGQQWYKREAARAVNQTLGRVIRHKHDFGAVLLLDNRYAKGDGLAPLAKDFSSWMRPQIVVQSSFQAALDSCRHFFGITAPVQPSPARPQAAQGDSGPPSGTPAAPTGAPGCPGGTPGPRATSESAAALQRLPARAEKAEPKSSMILLGALWKGQRPAEALARRSSSQGQASACAPPAPPAGDLSALLGRPVQRDPATPQGLVASSARRVASVPGVAPPPVGAGPRWLQAAAELLPRMEHERVTEQLALARQQADLVVAGRSADDERLVAALRAVAEALLPAFCLDTAAEARRRAALVRECALLLPELLRPLWRKTVEEVAITRGVPYRSGEIHTIVMQIISLIINFLRGWLGIRARSSSHEVDFPPRNNGCRCGGTVGIFGSSTIFPKQLVQLKGPIYRF